MTTRYLPSGRFYSNFYPCWTRLNNKFQMAKKNESLSPLQILSWKQWSLNRTVKSSRKKIKWDLPVRSLGHLKRKEINKFIKVQFFSARVLFCLKLRLKWILGSRILDLATKNGLKFHSQWLDLGFNVASFEYKLLLTVEIH